MKNPVATKLALIALDQINIWMMFWQAAKANPDMTDAEADALVAKTKAETITISDAWRDHRAE